MTDCSICGQDVFTPGHSVMACGRGDADIAAGRSTRKPIGRPKGFDGTKSKQPSALAQAFKRSGLDWKADFASAIKNRDEERIRLWLKLLPYMITTSKRAKVKKWKGKASRAALVALEAMEQEI